MKTTTKRPRIRFFDLETSHNLVAAFNLYGKDYIPHDNIIQERYIICGGWKDLGEKKVHSVSVLDDSKRYKKNPHDDYFVTKKMAEAVADTDIIVAHNGKKYDWPFLNGRCLAHGIGPLPPVQMVDTYLVAKRNFLINSNSLDYLGKYTGVGRKIKTSPGLWIRVLMGERAAVQEMVTYMGGDVQLLEDVFLKMLGYLPDINHRLFGNPVGCPRCGSDHVQRRGNHVALTRTYQRYQCQNPKCGGWFREDKPVESTSARSL